LRVVIVHGRYGSASRNWFPRLAERVRELGHEAIVPQFPTPTGQNLSRWLRVFDEQAGSLSCNTILVGHSLGVAFILRLLERTGEPIAGAFLVAGFLGARGLLLRSLNPHQDRLSGLPGSAFEGCTEILDIYWLGDISVHSSGQAPFPVALHGVRRHCHDQQVCG